MKNYFHILGLEKGATEDQIRKAFRAKAKQYHPDVNDDEDARQHFMEAQQAYSFLINHAQRRNYEVLLSEERLSKSESERRELIYKLWVEHQQRKARTRTATETAYYSENHNPFNKRFWRGINLFYNISFLIIFGFILVMPMINYYNQLEKPIGHQRPFFYFLVPTLLGAIFMSYGYYYWFILKTDQE